MKQRYEVVLSLGSWIYTAALVGLCGGIVFGLLSALWSAFHGQWAGALLVLVIAPVCATVSFSLYALIGYPVYYKLAGRTPAARTLAGRFVETPHEEP